MCESIGHRPLRGRCLKGETGSYMKFLPFVKFPDGICDSWWGYWVALLLQCAFSTGLQQSKHILRKTQTQVLQVTKVCEEWLPWFAFLPCFQQEEPRRNGIHRCSKWCQLAKRKHQEDHLEDDCTMKGNMTTDSRIKKPGDCVWKGQNSEVDSWKCWFTS